MTTLSKTLLTVAVTGLGAGGILDFNGFKLNPAWAVMLPFGAIAYGMFLISFMLEKEVAKFDEDEAKELKLIKDRYATLAPKTKPGLDDHNFIPVRKFGH
jgi:hypothetical protein